MSSYGSDWVPSRLHYCFGIFSAWKEYLRLETSCQKPAWLFLHGILPLKVWPWVMPQGFTYVGNNHNWNCWYIGRILLDHIRSIHSCNLNHTWAILRTRQITRQALLRILRLLRLRFCGQPGSRLLLSLLGFLEVAGHAAAQPKSWWSHLGRIHENSK